MNRKHFSLRLQNLERRPLPPCSAVDLSFLTDNELIRAGEILALGKVQACVDLTGDLLTEWDTMMATAAARVEQTEAA